MGAILIALESMQSSPPPAMVGERKMTSIMGAFGTLQKRMNPAEQHQSTDPIQSPTTI